MVKNKHNALLIFFILTIICSQIIIHYAISKQSSGAEILNTAGKQRMYSQQITKLALYSNNLKNTTLSAQNIAALKKIIQRFKKADSYLKQKNRLQFNSESLNILFKENNPYFNEIITSCNSYLENPENDDLLNQLLETVKTTRNPF